MILFQVKAKTEALSKIENDLVLDYVLYWNAFLLQIELKNIRLKQFTNLTMVGFGASGQKNLRIETTLLEKIQCKEQ